MATNAFEDLSIPALEGAADRPADLHLAQAEPTATPPQPAPVKTVIEVAADLTLTLPADATIDQPRVNGTDLEFVQPDGSVIVVPNGAVTGLVIVIGDATIPAETVATIFASNNIETAAGPEAAAALQSSGGNFATPVPGIGDGLPLIDLLGNTDFGLPTPALEDLEDRFGLRTASIDDGEPSAEDTSPRAEDGSVLLFDDEGQFDGRPGGIDDAAGDAKSFTGNLSFDYGPDGRGATGGIQFDLSTFKITDSKGDPLTLLQARVLDSGVWRTVDVTVTLSADGQTLTGTWLDATQTPRQAFIVEILDQDTGEYSIDISAALVHPFNDATPGTTPGSAFEDELNLSLGYVVTDSNGTQATASLQFGVDDDMPEVSVGDAYGDDESETPVSLTPINLDESRGADVYSSTDGAPDNNGATDEAGPNIGTIADPAGATPFGRLSTSLGGQGVGAIEALFGIDVAYGADGPKEKSQLTNALAFTLVDANPQTSGVKTTLSVTKAALGGNPDTDTSDAAITDYADRGIYLVRISATEIWGVVGPVVLNQGAVTNDIAIKLHLTFTEPTDLGTAQIVVEQFMAIDHDADNNAFDTPAWLKIAANEGSLGLTLTATATDGDGDAAASAPHTVTILDNTKAFVGFDDDGPRPLTVTYGRDQALFVVDEDGLPGANLDNPASDGETAGNGLKSQTVVAGNLNTLVDFGRDGSGGFGLAQINAADNRTVALTSRSGAIHIISDGTTLTGYVEAGAVDRNVFTLVLNNDGSFTFTLLDQVDHTPQPAGTATEDYLANALDLSAFVRAIDGDGDSVALATGAFTVQILDDIPRISAVPATSTTQPIFYDTGDVSGGNRPYVVLQGPNDMDLLFTGRTGTVQDTVNTSNDIGVGNGQNINGKDNGPEEYLTIDLVKHGHTTDGNSFSADAHYAAQNFSFEVSQVPGNGTASIFLQLFSVPSNADNGSATANFGDDSPVTITGIMVGSTPATLVPYTYGANSGWLITNVTQGSIVTVTGADLFSRVVIANYDGIGSVSGAKSFGIIPHGAGITAEIEALLRHDETAGTAFSPPNVADDAADPNLAGLKDGANVALGFAKSQTNAASFFTVLPGADEPGSLSYAVVDASGQPFNAAASGLTTTAGVAITLTTESGALVGYAGNQVAFKILAAPSGDIWVAQYLAIHHPTGGSTDAAIDEITVLATRLHLKATLTDADGDSVTALSDTAIRVTFQDDGPLAAPDTNSIPEGDTSISGNVVTGSDTLGADGAAVGGPVVGVTSATGNSDTNPVGDFVVAGRYGSLLLHADGSYTYTLDNANPAVAALRPGQSLSNEVFTYTIKDGDGDTASTTLSIRIDGTDDGVSIAGLGATGGDETVYENDLAAGTSPSAAALTQTGSFTVTAADGFDDLTVAGQPVVTNGAAVGLNSAFATAYGTITITSVNLTTGVVAYSYTLTHTAPHPVSGADALFDDIAILATDTDGDTAPATLSIKVVDDVPDAVNDQPTQSVENEVVIIDVLANDKAGADGLLSVTLVAPYNGPGTLTQNDGVFTFTPAPGQQGTVTFQYTLTDGDADSDPATVTITLLADSTPTVSVQSGTVDEKGLPNGSGETADSISSNDTSETATGTFTITTGGDTLAKLEVQDKFGAWLDVSNGGPVEGTFGMLTVIKTGNSYSWSYTLAGNATHPDDTQIGAADQLTDAFATRVTDSDGDSTDAVISASETITISINDDGPVAVDDTVVTPVAEDGSVLIDVFANDRAGADGVNLVSGLTIVSPPTNGTLLYNANGTFTYTATAGTEGPDSFTYQLTDGDGDISTATVSLTIAADSTPQISITKNASLDEDGLGAANADNTLPTEANGGGLYQDTGTIVVDFGKDQPADLLAAFKFQTTGLDDEIDALGHDVTWALSDNDRTLTGSANGTPVVTITITNASSNGAGVVTYTYQATLLQPVTHPLNDNEDAVSITGIPFTVTDKDSDTRSSSFAVAITDDVPELLVSNTPSSATEAGAPVNGTWSLAAGADGVTAVIVTFGAVSGTLNLSPGASVVLVQPTGTLTVAADHSWSFAAAANQNNAANPQASFTLAATDGDGDKTSDTQVVSITDGAGPTTSATPTSLSVEEKAVETTYATGSAETATAGNDSPLETDSKSIAFTAGSDAIVSVGFGNPSGITVDSNIDAVADIVWEPSGADLVGKIGGVVAITLSLSGFATIAAGGSGSVTVAATLSDNFPHLFGNNGPNTVVLNGITVVALDTDGTPATANVTVSVVDDVPQIAVDSTGPSTVAELATLNGTWSLNPGADGVPNPVMVSIAGGGYVATTTGPFVIAGKGTLSFGNGTWSFVAASGLDNTVPQSLAFTLKAIDADGDETTDTQSIAITDGAGPSTPVGTTPLSVNEEGLDTVNAHGSVNNASEADSQSISFTAGTDAITSFAFGSTSGIEVFTNDDATADIVWSIESGNLVGKINDIVAVTLTLTGSTIAAGATGSVTVQATLSDNFPHVTATGENSVTLTGVTVIAKDTDNSTATANVSLTVLDDVPVAAADTYGSTITGVAVIPALLDNDKFGADGVNTATGVSVTTGAAHGTVTYNGNGTFTYTPTGVYTGSDSFSYTIVDADGDPSTATVTLDIRINSEPVVDDGTSSLIVEEKALDQVASGSDLMRGAVTGTASNLTTETAVDTNGLKFTATGENIASIKFATPTGLNLPAIANMASGTASWSLSADERTLTLSIDGTVAMVLKLTGASTITAGTSDFVTVTATLVDSFAHHAPNSTLDVLLSGIKVVATDTSGDAVTATVGVTVKDDAPMVGSVTDVIAANVTGSATGHVGFVVGADTPSTWTLTPQTAVTGIAYTTVAQSDGGSLVTAKVGTTTFFTLDLNADGSYVFDLVTPRPTVEVPLDFSSAVSGGNGAFYTFAGSEPGTIDDVVIRAITNTGGGQTTINSTSAGFGVGNPRLSTGDVFRVEFGSALSPDTVTFKVTGYQGGGGASSLGWVATKNGVTVDSGNTGALPAVNSSFTVNPIGDFDQITFTQTGGADVQLGPAFALTTSIVPADATFAFGVTLTDSDGDSVTGVGDLQTIDVRLLGGGGSAATTLTGTSDPEVLAGGPVADTLNGGDGNDTLEGRGGGDSINGGNGFDVADYSHSATAVMINLTDLGGASGVAGGIATAGYISGGDATGDTLLNIEGLRGGLGNDDLRGNASANSLYGGAGDDFLDGEGGIDFLSGGLGNDTLTGGTGAADTFAFAEFGTANRDTITGYLATEGDKVDLSAILDSVFSPASDVTKFLHVSTDGVNSTVQVDTTGTGTFNSAGDVAVLSGVHVGDTITFIFDGTEHTVNVI